ncbi:MAG TPA: methyltransferase domain-containing protein [Planctomycetota bacterium]|nr:methyltransferase domain-containing protein [Planctomycetota bacterium]HRT92861.1 methyltransferase domain-containing protein [Planctomycetota bacterium]
MSGKATPEGWRRGDPVAIPGSYQYDALVAGPAVQRFWHRRKLELVSALVLLRAGMRALDVGCGSGVVAHFLAGQGAEVDAVDANEGAIRFARARFERGNLRFHLTAANEMAFADGSFDLIVCLEVIEHLPAAQVAALLGLLGRLLAAEGALLVSTPNGASLWPVIERLMDLFGLSPPMRGEQHITRFTRGRLVQALGAAGLDVRRSGRFCGVAPFLAGVSWRLAERLDTLEHRVGQPLGNLLYALAGKTPRP